MEKCVMIAVMSLLSVYLLIHNAESKTVGYVSFEQYMYVFLFSHVKRQLNNNYMYENID